MTDAFQLKPSAPDSVTNDCLGPLHLNWALEGLRLSGWETLLKPY